MRGHVRHVFLREELGQTSQISGGSGRHFLEYDAPSSPVHFDRAIRWDSFGTRSIFFSIKFRPENRDLSSSESVDGNGRRWSPLPSSNIRILVAVDKRLGVKPRWKRRFPRETIAGQSKWNGGQGRERIVVDLLLEWLSTPEATSCCRDKPRRWKSEPVFTDACLAMRNSLSP